MSLYLCDKPFGENGLKLAKLDPDAKIVLIKDGVYLDVKEVSGKKVYAMKDDVEKRGILKKVEGVAELIDYPELVDLIVENKVMNFI
jgi:sulfur relay protein TusB/DsrH